MRALLIVSLVATTTVVAAQDHSLDAEARALFEAGRLAFDAERYDDALGHFRNAYQRSQRDELLYNIALSADRAGHHREALEAYEKFLDGIPDTPRRVEIQRRLAELREVVASEPEMPSPFEPPNEPETQSGIQQEPVVDPTLIVPQQSTEPSLPEPPDRTPPQEPQPDPEPTLVDPATQQTQREPAGSGPGVAPVLTIIGGGVLAIGGAVMLGLASSYKSSAENTDSIYWADVDQADRTPALSGAGVAFLGVGVVVAVAGLIWKLASGRTTTTRAGLRLDAAGLRGTF